MVIDGQGTLEAAFGELDRPEYARLTRELTGYCYRMLGSPFDAEDAAQETMMRAWRQHERFEGRSSLRTWLYRIATNVCIDMLRSRSRRGVPMDLQSPTSVEGLTLPAPLPESKWVLPVPDAWLQADPAQRAISRESVRVAFIAAIQRLTPRQRAILILRDVLQFSAAESAGILGTTVASANSALQRARATLAATDPSGAPELDLERTADPAGPGPSPRDLELLAEYISAFEAYDIERLTRLLREDAIQAMPPFAMWLSGRDSIAQFMLGPGAECRGSRILPTSANGCPAFAQYRADPAGGHFPWALHVLETDGERISTVHSFVMMPALFTVFGFPQKL
jgi:RNA polymerase sigma-70 factor (ECF subfamily)